MASRCLPMWTIFQTRRGPVAQLWEVRPAGPQPTPRMLRGPLTALRQHFEDQGLYRLSRDESDDPAIIETWL